MTKNKSGLIIYFFIGFSLGFFISLLGDLLDDGVHGIDRTGQNGLSHAIIPILVGVLFGSVAIVYWIKEDNRKKVENELIQSEKRFRLFYQNSPLSYQSLDSDGIILEVNDAWMEEMEYQNKEDVIGKSFVSFVHDSQKDLFPKRFGMFKEKKTVSGIEWKMITNHNKVKYMLLDGKFSCVNGLPERTFCVFRNITDEKLAEKKLIEARERLNRLERLDTVYRLG